MCVELLKVELASNEEYHRSHGLIKGILVTSCHLKDYLFDF